MKYKSPKQVMVKLLQGGKRRSMQEIKTRHKNNNPLYSELIQEGINLYDEYMAEREVRTYIDPEKELTVQEWEDMVGLKG